MIDVNLLIPEDDPTVKVMPFTTDAPPEDRDLVWIHFAEAAEMGSNRDQVERILIARQERLATKLRYDALINGCIVGGPSTSDRIRWDSHGEFVVDFGRNPANSLVATIPWSATASSPSRDLDAAIKQSVKPAGLIEDPFVVMDSSNYSCLRSREEGVRQSTIHDIEARIYVFDRGYRDGSAEEVRFVSYLHGRVLVIGGLSHKMGKEAEARPLGRIYMREAADPLPRPERCVLVQFELAFDLELPDAVVALDPSH